MPRDPNELRWDGSPGHYEVYYVTLTDHRTGVGVWIRYTLLAPLPRAGDSPSAALWFLAMDPRADRRHTIGRKATLPAESLSIDGTVTIAGEHLELHGARGAQAHLWGSKHAGSWAWAHCNDFATLEGKRADGAFVDGVSVLLSRFGREVGPSTPVVGSIDGRDFRSTSPLRVLSNQSLFSSTSWRFEAVDGELKLIGQVDAERDQLAGVTYRDPDGELAYCYNSETASMRLYVYKRARRVGGWAHRQTLIARGRAHFEYAQRAAVPDLELHTS